MLTECNGIFVGTAPAYDGETLVALQNWATHTLHKQLYALGPLLPPGYGAPTSIAPRDIEMKAFLEAMETKFGENSVLLVSFRLPFLVCDRF